MMRLDALIEGLELRLERGSAERVVRDLVDDSRRAAAGCAFIARAGEQTEGSAFINDAIRRGAAAIITDTPAPPELPNDVAWVRAARADVALAAELARRYFDDPSRALKLAGVTGTNGKTTVATLTRHLIESAGVPCGLIGTLGATGPTLPAATAATANGADGAPIDTGLTTPGPIELTRLLAQMRDAGCRAVVAEVSSHALVQGRIAQLDIAVGVFTNLTGDHLDYHGSMERYAQAKARLFERIGPSGWAVINADDPWAGQMLDAFAGPPERRLRCAVQSDAKVECRATVLALESGHSRARFDGPWGSTEATLPLVGRHNIVNALQAAAAAHAIVDLSAVLCRALRRCPSVPGRLEKVSGSGWVDGAGAGEARCETSDLPPEAAPREPTVLVDYAHTHDALANVLMALRPLTRGKLRVVFGCGGDRDREKRPKMAQVAARFADVIWITSDNPRTEDPQRIIDEVMEGFAMGDGRCAASEIASASASVSGTSDIGHRTSNIHTEVDRAEAIAAAVRSAEPGDTVLIAGKGHEDYQIFADRTIHFDDREQAAAALRQWHRSFNEGKRSAPWPPTT